MYHFKECKSCENKPGAALLCEACIHNRDTISKLQDQLLRDDKEIREKLTKSLMGQMGIPIITFKWFEVFTEIGKLLERASRNEMESEAKQPGKVFGQSYDFPPKRHYDGGICDCIVV